MKKVLSVCLSLLLGLTALVVPSAAEGAAVLTHGFEQDYEMQINSKWSIYTAANEADKMFTAAVDPCIMRGRATIPMLPIWPTTAFC